MSKIKIIFSIIEKILYSLAIITFSFPIIFGIITVIVGIYVGYIEDKYNSEVGIIENTPSIISSLLGSLLICFCNMPIWFLLTIIFITIGIIIHRKSINK